jgi:diguanylate cyclase (GGDEF)-like protein
VRDQHPLGVVLADLDQFKRVNDLYGHAAGDAALQEVAQRLSGALRPQDRIGRYGGEEFLAVLPGCDWSASLAVAERLRATVSSTPLMAARLTAPLTLSVGLAVWPGTPGLATDALLQAADIALERAKQSGRNRIEISHPTPAEESPSATSLSLLSLWEYAAR